MSTKLKGILQQPAFVGKEACTIIRNEPDFVAERAKRFGCLLDKPSFRKPWRLPLRRFPFKSSTIGRPPSPA